MTQFGITAPVEVTEILGVSKCYVFTPAEGVDWQGFLRYLESLGESHSTRHEVVYHSKDLAAAELLNLSFDVAEKGDAGIEMGTAYDSQGSCPDCWSGARLVGPLMMHQKDLPKKRPIANTFGPSLLREDVAYSLADAFACLDDLVEVRDAMTGATLPWRAISPRRILPPLASATRGVIVSPKRRCPRCGRDGFFHTNNESFEPALSRRGSVSSGGRLPDLAASWEGFGIGVRPPGVGGGPADPLLFVNQRVYQALAAMKIRGLRWVPVTLID